VERSDSVTEDELPEALVTDEEEGGFVDPNLALVTLESRPDGTLLAVGRGRHGSRNIGFAVELGAEWKPQPIGESDQFFYWGTGGFRSIGVESDALLSVLGELFGAAAVPARMRPETSVAVVGLGNDPRLTPEQPTHMKLFFESEDPTMYAEVYVNVFAAEAIGVARKRSGVQAHCSSRSV
jgi:hypothetical protein